MIKVALSFDDGRKDNYRLAEEVLIPMQIPATFNITTDYIMRMETEDILGLNLAMSKAEVIKLSENLLFEIAGHGKKHNNEYANLIGGIKQLREWCNLDRIGVASPNSKLTSADLGNAIDTYKKDGIAYVRIGNRFNQTEFIKKCFRKLNRKIHSGWISVWVYKDSMLSKNDAYILNSIPILHYNSLKEIKSIINNAVNMNRSCILMFHSVLKEGEEYYKDLWSWDFEQFQLLCNYLKRLEKEKKLKICKTMDLVSDVY